VEKSDSILIRKPIVEVFNYVADPEKFHLWQPFVREAKITSKKPIRQGTTYSYTFQALGKLYETNGVIREYIPFQHYTYETTSSPFPIKGGFRFRQVDDFVEVTAYGEADSRGHFSMAQSIISLLLGRQLKVMLQNLKDILECSE